MLIEDVENVKYRELNRLRKFVLRLVTPCLFWGGQLSECPQSLYPQREGPQQGPL
jgi:hypothetical protein